MSGCNNLGKNSLSLEPKSGVKLEKYPKKRKEKLIQIIKRT